MPITRKAPAVHDLCSAMLETLRMTIDENGMNVVKHPDNVHRIVARLDQIVDLTIAATQEMKIVSKKAHIKKNSLFSANERKVKSVMRGQKVTTNLHNSAQKLANASPPPKRMRNAAHHSQNHQM